MTVVPGCLRIRDNIESQISRPLDALSGNDFSLQSVVAKLIAAGKLQPIQVSEEEKALFRNLNEPGDL